MRELNAAVWAEVAAQLDRAFSELEADVRERVSIGALDRGTFMTELRPLWMYLSVSRSSGPDAEEDAVVGVSYQLEGDELVQTADVCTGTGVILAEGPSDRIPSTLSERAAVERILGGVAEVLTFVRASADTVTRALGEVLGPPH